MTTPTIRRSGRWSSETPGASFEARDAQRHVDAMVKHRAHVVTEIAGLEQKQDELLDRM